MSERHIEAGERHPTRIGLFSPATFSLIVLVATIVTMLTCALATPLMRVAVLGIYAALMVVLVLCTTTSELAGRVYRMRAPSWLACEQDLSRAYQELTDGVLGLGVQSDPVLRGFAARRLDAMSRELSALAAGRIVFGATEMWRKTYEDLLATLDIRTYYSVAWVQTDAYWRDSPGEQSMEFNFELITWGYRIERILILSDKLWAPNSVFPSGKVATWIRKQHERGILVSLVREPELLTEPELLSDFGIYGGRACGKQHVGQDGRTLEFEMQFDATSVRSAMDRWLRLKVYAVSWTELLDRAGAA